MPAGRDRRHRRRRRAHTAAESPRPRPRLPRGPVRADGGIDARRPDAAGWGPTSVNAAVLRPAGGRARRRRPPARARRRHDALAPAGAAPARARRDRVPPRVRRRPLPALAAPDARAGAAAGGRRAAPRRRLPGGMGGRRAPRLGRRVRGAGRALGVRPGAAAARRGARSDHAARRRHAALVDLPAGAAAVGGGDDRGAVGPVALARLRLRARPLHRAARPRPRRPDVRDRGRGPPAPRTPVFTRGYVTATGLHDDPATIADDPGRGGARRARAPRRGDAADPARADHPWGPLPRRGGVQARDLGGRRRRAWIRDVGEWDPAPGPPRGPVPAGRARRRSTRSGAAARRTSRCSTSCAARRGGPGRDAGSGRADRATDDRPPTDRPLNARR